MSKHKANRLSIFTVSLHGKQCKDAPGRQQQVLLALTVRCGGQLHGSADLGWAHSPCYNYHPAVSWLCSDLGDPRKQLGLIVRVRSKNCYRSHLNMSQVGGEGRERTETPWPTTETWLGMTQGRVIVWKPCSTSLPFSESAI